MSMRILWLLLPINEGLLSLLIEYKGDVMEENQDLEHPLIEIFKGKNQHFKKNMSKNSKVFEEDEKKLTYEKS